MGINLNLDSFRAMVGQSNYGEVRLSSTGTLEKINNHFLQHAFGFSETKNSPEENRLIRNLFLKALQADGMSKEVCDQIRQELRLDSYKDCRMPLKRRTIAEVLARFDADKLARQKGKENPLVQRFGTMKFADFKQMIQKLNATPNEVFVSLPNDKLEVFFNRYGGLFSQELAKSTFTSQNPEELDLEIGRRVREYLKDSVELTTLEVGEKAFSRGKDHVSESRQEALNGLGEILRKEQDDAKRRAAEKRLYDKCQVMRANFEESGIQKKFANSKLEPMLNNKGIEVGEKAVLVNKNIEFTEDDFKTIPRNESRLANANKDLDHTLNEMAGTIAKDRGRNPMNVYFNKKVYVFKFVGGDNTPDLHANANWNAATAKAFVNDLKAFLTKEKGDKFPLEQFLSACMAAGQGFARIPENVYSCDWLTADCSITLKGDKVTVDYTHELQVKNTKETKNYGLSVDFYQDGTARPTSLKPVDTPIKDLAKLDLNEFSILEPPKVTPEVQS